MKRHDFLILGVILLLAGLATAVFAVGKDKLSLGDAANTIAGLLAGAALTLTGTLLNSFRQEGIADRQKGDRRDRITTVITGELVNTATGCVAAHQFLKSAYQNKHQRGDITAADLKRHLPRPMSYTTGFGSELPTLSSRAVDCMVMLRANLQITEKNMQVIIDRGGSAYWPEVKELYLGICHDCRQLAECFEAVAPTRKLQEESGTIELFSERLKRLGNEDNHVSV